MTCESRSLWRWDTRLTWLDLRHLCMITCESRSLWRWDILLTVFDWGHRCMTRQPRSLWRWDTELTWFDSWHLCMMTCELRSLWRWDFRLTVFDWGLVEMDMLNVLVSQVFTKQVAFEKYLVSLRSLTQSVCQNGIFDTSVYCWRVWIWCGCSLLRYHNSRIT